MHSAAKSPDISPGADYGISAAAVKAATERNTAPGLARRLIQTERN